MRRGVRLGLDPGERRIGVARSDADGLLALPLATVRRGRGDLESLAELARESEAVEWVMGLPRHLSGAEGAGVAAARAFAADLAATTRLPVRLVDERLSTVSAQRSLHAAGRSTKSSRAVVDQAAAAVILQSALDAERQSDLPPGEVVEA